MHGYVCYKEREEEPARTITIEAARAPDMGYGQTLHHRISRVKNKPSKCKIYDTSDKSPYKIRNHQLFEFLLRKLPRITVYRFVEVSCLKEEERHEKERPMHHDGPPLILRHIAKTSNMVENHSDNADAT